MRLKLRLQTQGSRPKVEEILAPATSQHPPSVRYPGGVRPKGHAVFFALASVRPFVHSAASFRGAEERFPPPGISFTKSFERAHAAKMKRPGQSPALALAFAVLLTGILPGCATFGKCGFRGCAGDADITAHVRARLVQNSLQPPNLIQVQTLDRVVYLRGLVNTEAELLTAQSVALATPGVSRVINSIGLIGSR